MKESSEKMGLRTGLAVDEKDWFFMNMPKLSFEELKYYVTYSDDNMMKAKGRMTYFGIGWPERS